MLSDSHHHAFYLVESDVQSQNYLYRHEYWYLTELAKAHFVTRLKKNASYKVIKENRIFGKDGVTGDRIVRITGMKSEDYPKELGLVSYYDEETKKQFNFVTNDFKSSAKALSKSIMVSLLSMKNR